MTDLPQGNWTGDGATEPDAYPPLGRIGNASDSPSAKDKATDVAQTGKQAAGEVAQTATTAAKDVAQQTKDQARDLYGHTKSQLSDQVVTQKGAVVDSLRSLGDQLAAMTDHIDESGTAVDLAGKARDQARGAADWLDGHEPNEVLDELRSLGREKPGKFLLGALLAGVVAGRLTRGVVAVHTDDVDDSSAVAPSRVPATAGHQLPDAPALSSARHGTAPELPVARPSAYTRDGMSPR